VRLLAANPATGATTVLHEERDPAWVHITYGAPLRTAAGRLVHTSDRDGDRRLVIDGTPITPQGIQVVEVNGADGETVYFTAIQDPTEEHLWCHHPDHGLRRLSSTPGVHSGTANGGTVVRVERTEDGTAITASRAEETTEHPINVRAAEPVSSPESPGSRSGNGTCGRPCCCPPGTNQAQRSSRCC
jgi:dipeptidyl-peptidase-4